MRGASQVLGANGENVSVPISFNNFCYGVVGN